MCVIIVKKEGLTIPESTLEKAWKINPDGAGVAVWKGNRWIVKKGFMTLNHLLKAIRPYNREDTSLIIHFRAATHGGRTPELTHPFPIEFKEGRGWLFHNGVFNVDPEPDESDTSYFAKVVSKMNPKFEGFIEFLSNFANINYSRIALILESKPEIFRIGNWYEENGLLFSSIYSYSSSSSYYYDDYYDYYDSYCDLFTERKKHRKGKIRW